MEDITGLIIYLILAIIGILAGIYRNKNKTKSVQSPSAQPSSVEVETAESYESEYDPFAGIFDEKSEERDSAPENNIKEEEPFAGQDIGKEELTVEQKVDEEDAYNKEYEEGASVFDETRKVIISDNISEITAGEISNEELTKDIFFTEEEQPITTEQDESSEKKETFDARKAIIYSEIIKRREF
jgi:hypothetical protein